MKKKKNIKEVKWTSGINPKSSMSYEKYLKAGMEMIHKELTLRVYKLAPKEDYPAFERGTDLRIGFFWRGKPIMDKTRKPERKYEIIVESSFWYVSNKNKEDREYMRSCADIYLQQFHKAAQAGRDEWKKKAKTKTKAPKRKTKAKVGSTQDAFEKAKKTK